ncbi:thiolase-like protein [Aspergillus pseudoustus]|uniref:Thiolase-like protein n=1 Tax=Aspergillus pseudoustus TaxID=1810923 RepID=A0ABR4J1Q2_9EURO
MPASTGLYITGLGHQYPPYLQTPDKLDEFASRFYDTERPSLKKLLAVTHNTGIASRSSVQPYTPGTSSFAMGPTPPTITEIDTFYRAAGVDLTAQACKKALRDARTPASKITHTAAVTATSQGCPGFDLLVAQRLGLAISSSSPSRTKSVQRILIQGVGCAGGTAVLRAAAQLAQAATLRGEAARILAFACELCTPNVRHDLSEAAACGDPADVSIVAALFSDAAGAFVLCNGIALDEDREDKCNTGEGEEDEVRPWYELLEWGCDVIPDTVGLMGFVTEADGYRTILSRQVPEQAKIAIGPMFASLLPGYQKQLQRQIIQSSSSSAGPSAEQDPAPLTVHDFDWALHPGGAAIIDGAKEALNLSEDHVKTSRETYRTRGNSSSPTVLILLDKLKSAGQREHVVMTSFGPGITIEMALLRRSERDDDYGY